MRDFHNTSYKFVIEHKEFHQKANPERKPRRFGPPGSLTMEQTAWELGVSTQTMQKWHDKKIGPKRFYGIGRHFYYREQEVRNYWDNWFNRHSSKAVEVTDYVILN